MSVLVFFVDKSDNCLVATSAGYSLYLLDLTTDYEKFDARSCAYQSLKDSHAGSHEYSYESSLELDQSIFIIILYYF